MRPRAIACLFGLVLCGCRETAGPAPVDAAVAPNALGDAAEPAPVAAAPMVAKIGAGAVTLPGRAAIALPAAALPGRVREDLRSTYAVAELQEALRSETGPIAIELSGDATASMLRNVAASAPERAIVISDRTLTPMREREVPALRVLPVEGGFEVWEGETAIASGKDAEAIVSRVGKRAEPIAIDPRDTDDTAALRSLLAVATAISDEVGLALDFAPCVQPPAGMACVPGGPATVGRDDGPAEEKPARRILVSTYYIDDREVTNAQHDACAAAGGCKRRINGTQNIMRPFVGADQPAMPMDWRRAQRYCAWAGKRLPTEWEWEKAARGPDGEAWPWGDDEPTCDTAIYRECAPAGCTPYPGKEHRWDCNEHATKPVGSFPAGRYGLFDMAGNGYEWTASVGIESIDACGDACKGRDPQGPCDGAMPCGEGTQHRVLKSGSWYWPKHRTRGSHRRVEKIATGSHRLGMRCASTEPWLTTYPPASITTPAAARAQPEPPTEAQLAIFGAIERDAIEDKPICSEAVRKEKGWLREGGRSETHCRDPWPYLVSNEPRGHLWQPFLAELGGAYLGVGSDQNYSYIAEARSEWAWVMDYDPRVVRNHLRLRALILKAETPEAFIELFTESGSKRAMEILKEALADHPEWGAIKATYLGTREELHAYFEEQRRGHPKAPGFGWLHDPDDYAYIRLLYQQGRLMPIPADLLGTKAIRSVGAAAKKLEVPVRIFYTSNAPTAWGGTITPAFRDNLLALPFDERSLVLQTTPGGGFRQWGKWHHSVQWGRHTHELLALPGYDNVWKLIDDRIPAGDGDRTVSGLPASW